MDRVHLKAGSENIPLVVTKKLSLKYWLGVFLSVIERGPRFQKLSIRDSQNGIASPKWPRTIFRLGYSSNRPLQIRRMALKPVSAANPSMALARKG